MANVLCNCIWIPQRKVDPFSTLPNVRVLHGLPGACRRAKATIPLQWKNADLLEKAGDPNLKDVKRF